jgi:GNAT superfamily N-acetyltransferase
MTLFMDLELARKLESAEGHVSLGFAEARSALCAGVAAAIEREGVTAIFDGAGSPLTQTFGLGMQAPVTAPLLDELESFFVSRGAEVMHEVCPLAGAAALGLLCARGYAPIEVSNVLVHTLDDAPSLPTALRARPIDRATEAPAFIEASVAGWIGDEPAFAHVMRDLAMMTVGNRALVPFMVEEDDAVIATGSLGIVGDVALLAGACTVPAARGRGAQTALLAARLAAARERGCRIAMIVAEPGSRSQRNAERRGFRVAYTRTKWAKRS